MGIERYLCVGGIEVANPLRTLLYMRNLGNPCLATPPSLSECCWCPDWLPGYDSDVGAVLPPGATTIADATAAGWSVLTDTFTDPATDDAPWYDPAVPESADVLGVWIEEARLGVPWRRDARERVRGAALGPGRLGGRELVISGWLYTRSSAATAYGRQWLFEALAGGDGCEGCDLPDAVVWLFCAPDRPGAGKRTLKRVGLTGWDPEIEPEFPRACGFKFEATLTAEEGALFLDPVTVVDVPLAVGPVICNLCSPCPDAEPTPCSCGEVGNAPRTTTAPDSASAFCVPAEVQRVVAGMTPPALWRDATAIIRIAAGPEGLSNLRIRGWINPAGLDDLVYFDCVPPCMDIEVACVPPRGELVIDGTTRRATLVCDESEANGYAVLSSGGRRFSWPDIACHGLFVAVDSDAYLTGPEATVTIEAVERERG